MVEDIDHSIAQAKSPQSNGIFKQFYRAFLKEFFQTAFRNKVHASIDELQIDIDELIKDHNELGRHRKILLRENTAGHVQGIIAYCKGENNKLHLTDRC